MPCALVVPSIIPLTTDCSRFVSISSNRLGIVVLLNVFTNLLLWAEVVVIIANE